MSAERATKSLPLTEAVAFLHSFVQAAFVVFYTSWSTQSFNSISIILFLSHSAPASKLSTLALQHDQFATFWPALLSWFFNSSTSQQILAAPVLVSSPKGTISPHRPFRGLSRRSSMTSLSTTTSNNRTIYALAHPPPVVLPKVNRAKVVLQLHEVRATGRARPVFEIVPTACMAPKILRKSSHMIRKTTGYGPDDLVVVHADDYERPSTVHGAEHLEEDRPSRPILGAICHSRPSDAPTESRTEICLSDGSVWTCYASIGYYEFNMETENGLVIARWVARSKSVKRNKDLARPRRQSRELSPGSRRRFIFSVLSEDSEQHPKLGDLSSEELQVFHSYRLPPNSEEYKTINASDQMRALMITSSIWVALMEGWSQVVRADPTGRMLLAASRIGSQNSVLSSGSAASLQRPASWDIRTLPSWRKSSMRQASATASPRASMSSRPRSVSAGAYHPAKRRTTTSSNVDVEEPRQSLQTQVVSDEESDPEVDSDENTVIHEDPEEVEEAPAPQVEHKELKSVAREEQQDQTATPKPKKRNVAVRLLKRMACVKKIFRKRPLPWSKRGKR